MRKEMIFGILALFAAVLVLSACQTTGKATEITTNGTNQTNVTNMCFDSDGGLNYYQYGYVSIGSNLNASCLDSCYGSNLSECYCTDSGNANKKIYYCPYGCSNGACLQQSNQTANTCFDTDGGKNYTIAGSVYGINNNNYYNYSDSCIGSTRVLEWYCSGTDPLSINISCGYGYTCSVNRCVKTSPTNKTGFEK